MNQHYILCYIISNAVKNPFIVENFQRQNIENIGTEIENVEQTFTFFFFLLIYLNCHDSIP